MPSRTQLPQPSPDRPRRAPAVAMAAAAVLAVVATLLTACGDEGSSRAVRRSAPRPTTTDVAPDPSEEPAEGDFCVELAAVDAQLDVTEDPAAFVAAMSRLRRSAPAEIDDDLAVLAGVAEQLEGIDAEDPASMAEMFEVVMTPEVIAASTALEEYALSTCGLELDDPASTGDSGEPTSTVPDGSPTDLELEDIDAVEEANASATWPDKVTGTSISMNTDVQLYADESDALSPAEAMEACTAVRAALVRKNPQVTVAVLVGDRTLAAAPAGGECAPA